MMSLLIDMLSYTWRYRIDLDTLIPTSSRCANFRGDGSTDCLSLFHKLPPCLLSIKDPLRGLYNSLLSLNGQ